MPMVVLLNLGEDALVVRRQGYEGVPQNTGLPEWLTDGEDTGLAPGKKAPVLK